MGKQMIRLNIPVPPAPILEQAVGYSNDRHAHFLALWWEPCGDEVMVSDGFVAVTGHWPGYLAYVQHRAVYPCLIAYNLGSSEDPAKFQLVIDLEDRKAFVAPCQEAERLLNSQWESSQEKSITISSEELEKWLADLSEQFSHFPSMDELFSQIAEDQKHVATLQQWLGKQVQ